MTLTVLRPPPTHFTKTFKSKPREEDLSVGSGELSPIFASMVGDLLVFRILS